MLTLFQLELLDTGLIRSDGGALDTDTILLDGLSGLDGDLVIGLVTVLETLQEKGQLSSVETCSRSHKNAYQVVVLEIDIKEASLSKPRYKKAEEYVHNLRQDQLQQQAIVSQ